MRFVFLLTLVATGFACTDESGRSAPDGDSLSRTGGDPLAGDSTGGGDATSWGDSASGDSGPLAGGDQLATTPCSPPPTTVIDVSIDDLKAAIDANETIAIVDVREPAETSLGVVEGALLYPWTSGVLETDHADLPDDRPLYVYCRSGGRSAQATAFLVNNGHTCVHNVLGGMNAWSAAGYPTVVP